MIYICSMGDILQPPHKNLTPIVHCIRFKHLIRHHDIDIILETMNVNFKRSVVLSSSVCKNVYRKSCRCSEVNRTSA